MIIHSKEEKLIGETSQYLRQRECCDSTAVRKRHRILLRDAECRFLKILAFILKRKSSFLDLMASKRCLKVCECDAFCNLQKAERMLSKTMFLI